MASLLCEAAVVRFLSIGYTKAGLWEPWALLLTEGRSPNEARRLGLLIGGDPWGRCLLAEEAPIISPPHYTIGVQKGVFGHRRVCVFGHILWI